MKKKEFSPEENKRLCKGCSACCRYITAEIDAPKNIDDIDEIVWFLLHKTSVFIGRNNKWYLDIPLACSALKKNGQCRIYSERPIVCREYSQVECEGHGRKDNDLKVAFKEPEAFMSWAEKKSGLAMFVKKYKKILMQDSLAG